ncbi:hypothetical protein MXD81_56835 [Microbacteriaceae bacterium K1510]|nr:hypothetical protein [Microbacteriaceae bacterium K1510]
MSRHSTKSAGRSTKTARTSAKKTSKATTKSARGSVKTATKSARQPVGKAPSKTSAKRAATKTVAKAAPARKPAPKPIVTEAPLAPTAPVMPIVHTISPPVQPIVVPEIPVRAHKYHVGDTVYYTSPSFGRAAATGSYTVVKLLPSDGEDYQYRIKSSGEAFERVAKESQLDRA